MTIIACYKLCKKGNLCVVVWVADKQVYFNFGFCDSSGCTRGSEDCYHWKNICHIHSSVSILNSNKLNVTLCFTYKDPFRLTMNWHIFYSRRQKITVDLNSIRCRLDRCCIKLSNTIMRTLREHLLKMLILSEDKAYFVMDLNTHHLLGWVDLSNFIEVNITPARDGRVGLWCDLVCWINILPQDSVICSSWMDRTGVFLLNLHV